MPEALDLWETPKAEYTTMIAGWRQWADAGSTSSELPQYLIKQTGARQIGTLRPDGFYLFQIPGTHDLVRPVVRFEDGYPESLEIRRNELFYAANAERQQGTVIFLGDEPHLDIERYTDAFLQAAKTLGVKRIISLGGVYGELPYNKERMVSCIYSLPSLKEELDHLAVNFSDYHGGASIGSYLCRRAGDQEIEFVGMYTFCPAYSFAEPALSGNSIRIETDFMAWFGVMRRINYLLKTGFDLSDLERRSAQVVRVMDAKIAELEHAAPHLNVREYLDKLSENFTEVTFDPLADVWEEELRRLLDNDSDDAELP
jgi:hypothetical protein